MDFKCANYLKYVLFTGVFLLKFSGYSQRYLPMLQTGNQWHLKSCFGGCITDMYYLEKDTLLNNEHYFILNGFHYISRKFLLREDTVSQRVYMLFTENLPMRQYLLYDFSLQAGDTIFMQNPISPFPEQQGDFICDSITRKTLQDGESHRIYHFHPIDSNLALVNKAKWIEGIGSLSMINAPGGEPDSLKVGELSCFFSEGKLIYQLDSNECNYVYIPTGITNLKPQEVSISVQNETIHISSKQNISTIQLYSINGITLHHFEGYNRTTFSTPTTLSMKGIVIVKLIFDTGATSTKKLFIQ